MRIVFFCTLLSTAALLSCDAGSLKQKEAARLPDQAVPDTSSTASTPRANLWKSHGCELITDAELQQLFGFDIKGDFLNSRTLPDQAFCLRTWNKPDWKERETNNEKEGTQWLDSQNRLVVQVFGYQTNEQAKLQLGQLRRDRRNTYEEDVPGLGDEAIWSTSTVTLLVRKGHLVLSLALNAVDIPHDNLQKAKELAAIALKKM
jgi:hypothetical protein